MKSIFKKFILLLLSLSLVSVFAYGQKPDLYTTLPTPIEVTSFPYFVDNFDSDAMAEGAPTGMQGACPTFPCCSGVWYKITLDTRGSLVSALETTKTIPPSSGLVWFKAESDDITTTDQLTYINSSNNFCGFAGFTSPSRGYAWRFKYTPSYNSESSESQSPANMSSFNSTYLSDPFPSDLTQYPGSGWRNDIELESGEHYLEPGTYWLYAWNKNQLEGVGGEQTKFVIDFVELCPDGFTCTNESVTICDTESYTTQNGQVITETTSVEETIGTEITTYNITVDEAITCCPDGYTCSEVDVTECASLTYTTPGGNTTSETGAVLDEDTEAQTRTVYNVTFDRVESKADVFQDAIITASGSVTYQANTNVTGVLSFDKAQDYWVDLNALQDDLNGTNRSAFMWVKSEADVVSNDQILFAINTGSGGNVAIFKIDNDGENLELFDGSDNQSASYDMGDEQWHYVGYTYNAATTETVVYVDGIENDRFRDNQSTVADSKYSLGQEFDGGSDSDHMNGDMAEISIWDEVLTGAEIKAAMQSKITNSHPKYANLVGYYSTFGECSEDATVLKDHSGKGNDGVMQNGLQVDFKNVQAIEGFNAIDWYTNLSWSKDGAEISTDATYTTDVAAGSYSFTATRDFIKATDSWTMTLNSNAATVDEIADETLCADDPITRTVTTNTVNYLDFEEAEENHISIDGLADNLANKSRSAFMWLNKESNIGSGGFDEVLVFQDTDVDNLSRFYIRETERLALWDGTNDRLNSRVLSNDTWYFVGYTYDHTTGEAKLYVNGTEEDAGTLSMPLGLGWFTSIGMKYNDNGPVDHMDGKLAEITFWDVVLTPEEITGLMAAAPANDAANLVASYGTLKNIADNQLRDLTGNGYDGLTSHNTIIIKDMEDTLANYDASANYLISWKKTGTEFDTDAIGNIKIDEGTTAYSVSYGTPLFQKTEEFSLSYTNLLPTQPVSTTVGALGSVTFEVDEIAGASYQWFKRGFGAQEINSGNNGIPTTGIFNDLKESNGIVYLGTRDGLSISRDNGNSFITISSSTPGFGDEDDILKIQADGDKVYAMTRSFLNISDDQGTSWRSIDFSQALSSIHSVAIDFQVIGDEIHLIGKTSHNTDFYYRSLDGGENWTSREISFTTNSSVLLSTSYKSLFVDGSTILITATGSNSSAGTLTGGMVRSNDGGITWEREIPGVDGYPSGNYFQSIFKKNEVIYLGGFNGLYISNDDGTTWVSGDNLTNYKNTTGVDDIVSVGNRVYVSSAGIQYTDDNGQNWVDLNEDFDPRLRSIAISDMGSYAINLATGLFDQLFVVNDREELENETDNTSPNQIQGATTSRLTINNLSLDQNDVEYFVEVSKDGCTQPSDDVTLTVLDIPIITQYTPARGGSDIDPAATISIEWSKDITAGTTGALRIFESDTDTEVQSFAPGDLSITGSTLSITPTNLDNSTSYYITIDADLVKDAGDGGNLALSGKDSWTFSTACETLVTAQPTDQSRLVGGSASFSVPVVSGASYQWFQNTEIATNIDPESNIGLSSIGSAYADGENYYVTGGSMRQSYFSSDQGMTWKDISTNRSGLYIYADGNQIYQSGTDGIAVSYDAGVSFKEIGNIENGLQESPGLTWDFVYGKEDRIYLKMRQFYVSLDRGDNFVAKNLIANGVEPGSVFEIREYDGVLHLATSSGLYLSSDYGDTFTRKTTADGLASDNVTASLNINGILYLVSITGKNPDAVYRIEVSTDSGGSFTTISETILGSTEIRNIAAGPDGKLYVATPQGIRISDDQGQTFELLTISNELGANDILQVHVGSDYTIYAVTSKGLTVVTTRVKVTNSQDLSSANAISGANTEVLTVDNLTLSADQSEYFVTVAKGDCQESSDDVTLSVSCEPLVLTQPADQNSAQGGSATFSVPEVSGASYQWYRRGRWVNSKQESNPFPIDDIVVVEDEGAATDNIVTFVDGRMYIATPSGLVSRANEEADWEVTDASSGNNFPSNQVNAVVSSSSKAVYAATSAGLAVLRPNETNWEVYNTQSGNGFPSTNQISNVFVSEDETIYLLSREPTSLAILEAGETTWDVIDETTSGNFSDLGSILYDVLATEDGAVYISTRANGFFRLPSTVPFFKTWEKFDRFNSDLSLGSIYNLSYANGKIYAHGSGLVTGYAPEMEIFDIATNTWSSFDNPKGNAFPPSATIYGLNNDNGTLYAQVEEDLYRLGNGGSEWNLITDLSASNGRGYIYHFEETYYRPSETQGLSTLTDIALSNDPAENTESNSISGATSTTLTIDNLSLEHSTTEYFVVVTKGECEETSDFAQVNVLDVPLITSFFPAQNAVDVPLDGDLILNYNRSVAPRAGNIKIFEYDTDVEVLSIPIENTTRSGGTISFTEPLNLQPGTKYYVTIDAGVVSDSGSNLSLAVTDKDYWSFVTDCGGLITTQLMDQTAGIGESVTFEIPEIAGATYQWRQSVNGIFGAISDEPGKIEGTSTKSLTISNLEASDNGNRYLLKVTTDNCEAFTNNVQLNVTTGPPSTDPFIITIITTAADESFSIPAPSDYNYNFYVEWGDGGVNSAQTSEVSYTYTTAGTYDVKIYGDFPNPAFGVNTSNARKITDIKAWGDIAWESFNQAFEGSSLTILSVSEAPDLSNVTDLSEMFRAARSFNDDLSAWDVSNVNNMSNLFNSADAFNGDISTWNVANVTTMEGMFRDCETFNQDVSGWNVSNVINMDDMFNYAEVFDADISSWNVSNVTSMSGTFLNARVFNQDISSWSVDNVTNMSSLFGNARLFNQDISSWNVAAVTSMSSMFNSAHAFNQDISGWNVDNVTSMSRMFSGTEAFNHSLDAWNVSNVTNMSEMFSGAVVFNSSISSWNVSNVTDMSEMFLDALAFNQDISSWDVSSSLVFNNMFEDAPSFDQNLGSWNIKPALEDDAEALADMFNGSGLTTANYDNILIGWASIDGLPDEAYLYNVPATYCISEERRDYLLNTLSWEINDQGKATDCVITGPILSATLPADNAIEVSLSPSIQITFDQTVNKGTGEIEIRRSSDDQVLTSISVASTLVTVDNAIASIQLGDSQLAIETEYYITIPSGAFTTIAGTAFDGITDKTTWSFTTIEGLKLVSLTPVNGATDVSENSFSMEFNYPIETTLYSNAYLNLVEDDSRIATLGFSSSNIEYSEDKKTISFYFSDESIQSDVPIVLAGNTAYYITMINFITSSTTGEFFSLDEKTDWTFTTAETSFSADVLSPENNAEGISRNLQDNEWEFIAGTIPGHVLYFARDITVSNAGAFTLYNGSTDEVVYTVNLATNPATVLNMSDLEDEFESETPLAEYAGVIVIKSSGNDVITIKDDYQMEAGQQYYWNVDESAITANDGKTFVGISDKNTWSFTTELVVEGSISIASLSPADNSTNLDPNIINTSSATLPRFSVTFEEAIKNGNTDAVFELYDAATDELLSSQTLNSTIAAPGVNPAQHDFGFYSYTFEKGKSYYILVEEGMFLSSANDAPSVGITNKTVWNFSTIPSPGAPSLTAVSPMAGATGISVTSDIILTFNENIQSGSVEGASVRLFSDDNVEVAAFSSDQMTISGTKVTIAITSDLAFSTTYYILIDDEAFVSFNNVSFSGVSDATLYTFTTEDKRNTPPVAGEVSFEGNIEVNQELTANYSYTDADSDTESGTTFQWYSADDASGANKTAISGATAQTFTLTNNESAKYVALGITPNDGKDAGQEVFSNYDGPIAAAVVPTVVSTLPTDGAVDIGVNPTLTIVMSEPVTAGSGSIFISGDGFNTGISATGSNVEINAETITISDLTGGFGSLPYGKFFTVTFDATAFVDADGNNSAGLSSQTAWNFTTKEANVAPVAQGVSIKKSLVVDGELQGSYTYFDDNGDTEAGTVYSWYRSDDNTGTNKIAISGPTAQNYTVVTADNGKYLTFEVTPSDGTLSGEASESAYFGPILINDGNTNIPPAFTSDALTSIKDNETYTYTVTYEDINNDVPVLTKTTGPAWLSVTGFELSGSPTASNIGDHQVVLTLDDQNGGTVTQAFTITVIQSNTAPTAVSVAVDVHFNFNVGMPFGGVYNFIDAEQDTDNSTYKWYRSDDNAGANKTEIPGAASKIYKATIDDAGKYLSFEVTPNDGKVDGTAVESEAVGPITKKIPSLSLAAINKVYGDADFDLSATTNSSGAITYTFDNDQTGANLSDVRVTLGNVGQITVNVSLAADAEYTARTVQGTITVSKRPITFTAQNASKVYGAADPSFFSFDVTQGNLVSDAEVIRLSRDAGEAVGTYSINLSEGEGAENYDITTVGGTFTITKVPITVTAVAATKVYGDADPTFTYNITSGALITGDELSGAITRVVGNNVGTYAMESSLFNGNYDITFVSADLTITKKALTATADDKSRTYGEANPELTITYEGFVNGDDAIALGDGLPFARTTATTSSSAGTYAITLSGSDTDNYTVNLVDGTLTVGKASLTATAEDKSRTYGDANPELTITYEGFVNGDNAPALGDGLPFARTTATAGSPAGTYAITLSGSDTDNYTVSLVDGTLTVGKASLKATADDKMRNEGEENPVLTISYNGFINGDDASELDTPPSIATAATLASDPGTYDITLSGGSDNNYALTLVNGKLTVNAVNNAPTVANAIANKTEEEGFTSNTVDLSNVFADADSDALTYTASSSEVGIATVSITGSTLTYTEVAAGTTTITVTANDGKGGTVSDDFTVTINAAPVNNAPTLANAITDKTEDEGFTSNTVDLTTVFADADSDALTYTASSSTEGVATVAVSGTTLTYSEVSVGTTTITVTANDGKGGTVSDDFTVTINAAPVNNPPIVANAITDITEDEGFTSNTVDLTNVFSDADSDALTYTASSSTEGVATVTLSGTTLTYSEVAVGTTAITVTANDGKGGTVTDEFTVTINAAPVNNAPTVANAITDKTEDEGFASNTVDLTTVFADADSDALTYTASSSAEGVATVAVSGTILTYTEVAAGITTITVTANDGKGGTVTDEFTVTIIAAPVNNAPTVANAITDKTEDEGFANNTVDLSTVFADADSDVLTYTASSSTEGVATVALSGTTLTYTEVAVGITTITVTANDGKGGSVSDDFTVTINAAPVNNAPTVANAIADKSEDEGFTSNTVDLTTVFADADSDVLTYTASSITEGVATVAVSGTTLTYTEVSVGTTTITVTANDGKGGTVSDEFTLTINAAPVNNAPTLANAITDKTEDEGFTSNTVDLSNVFADADSDALTYTVISSTEGVATVAVSGTTLTYTEVAVGTTTITVTANDGKGGTVTDDFTLTINAAPVNNVPIVANAIADQTEIEGFRLLTIDLINVFTDVDEDALLFTAVSSNTSIASVSVSGFNLDISEEAIGTVTITVTADDGRGGIATDEFSLSILEAAVPQEAEIPQGFSPNGDGVNDMWQVPNIENFPNNTVTIFDRQGNKVYQAKGYNNADVSFEGLASSGAINKSQGLSDGVYYYIIDLGNGESRKGSIIIKQ